MLCVCCQRIGQDFATEHLRRTSIFIFTSKNIKIFSVPLHHQHLKWRSVDVSLLGKRKRFQVLFFYISRRTYNTKALSYSLFSPFLQSFPYDADRLCNKCISLHHKFNPNPLLLWISMIIIFGQTTLTMTRRRSQAPATTTAIAMTATTMTADLVTTMTKTMTVNTPTIDISRYSRSFIWKKQVLCPCLFSIPFRIDVSPIWIRTIYA